ncbi:MAG TPA: IS256 family transposase [Candidatus Limnocylindria bacterium]|nr:IS256 family transposase [Candidatus Limnocylindria bacterium]
MPTWDTLEEFLRSHIQATMQRVLEEELTAVLGRRKCERRAGVDPAPGYRNGYGKPRKLTLACGTIQLRRPRARDMEERFESRVLPLFATRGRQIDALLPELYMHGLAKGDFGLALRGLLGDGAALSPCVIERLRTNWQHDYEAWCTRDLSDRELVYLWADGVYVKAGLEREKAALLVVIGAMADGTKEVLAVRPGYRESTESWKTLFADLQARGLEAPKLVVADGAAGAWAAAGAVWPQAREQRCWNHKLMNVIDQLPPKLRGAAREQLCRIPYAATRAAAEKLRERFAKAYRRTHPRAVEILEKDWERMVAFYDFPREHWKHLRTTNVIESPFAAVRLRTDAAKRFKKTENATAMIWRLLLVAERRFRKLHAAHLAVEVYRGVAYEDGVKVKKTNQKVAA